MPRAAFENHAARRLLGVARLLRGPLAGPIPVNDRGVRMDLECHVMGEVLHRSGLPRIDEVGAVRARATFRQQCRMITGPTAEMHRVEDRWFDGPDGDVQVRIYTPRGGPEPLPAIVYYHGGGFVVGDLDTHDGPCRQLARGADATVIAVHYRLAPEDPFPAGVEDSCAAFRWVYANAEALRVDRERLAVGGDSAGGNLSAVVCQQLRDEGHPLPCWQLLIYPATDLTRSMESHRTFADARILQKETMDWFLASYLTDVSQKTDPRGSPLVTRDLSGLPPAHVVVAGFDPLRDEGEAYGDALMAAGVPTTMRCYGSLPHGFFSLGGLVESARFAQRDIVAEARRALWAG